MRNIVHTVTVFVKARMVTLGVIDLDLQIRLPLGVEQLGVVNVPILGHIAPRRHRGQHAQGHIGAGAEHGHDKEHHHEDK